MTAYLNKANGNGVSFVPVNGGKEIASGSGGNGLGVILTDLNNDGKADYLYVHDGGAIDAWYNGGPKSDGWNWIGPTQIASGVPNAKQNNVIFADINGDGRSDYMVKGDKGSLNLWLNTGDVGSQKINWVPAGEIAGGLGTPNITLADLTGDGKPTHPPTFSVQLNGRIVPLFASLASPRIMAILTTTTLPINLAGI